MNKQQFYMKPTLMVVFIFLVTQLKPQMSVVYSKSAEISKDAKKGLFAGTFVNPNGSAELFFFSSDGPYGYIFSPEGKFTGESQGGQVVTDMLTMQNAVSQDEVYENLPRVEEMDIIRGSSTWTGNLAVKTGKIYLDATEKFNYGVGLDEGQVMKPKLDDTWMSKLIGYRSYSPYQEIVLTAYNKHQRLFKFPESGKYVYAPVDGGSIQAAGVVVEKISIRNPSSNNQNTIAVFSLSGPKLENMTSNVILTPYSMQPMGVGKSTNDGMAIMVMPVNAPSTYKPHKRLRPEEGKRLDLFVYRVNSENEVIDSVNFASTSSAVTFQYLTDVDNKSDLIIGFGNDKNTKWRWPFAGMQLNVIQFIRLDDNGQVDIHKTYTEDEIDSKLIVPGSKKNKFKLKFYNSPEWYWVKQLDNGNYFFWGHADNSSLAMMTDGQGNLIHIYGIERQDPEKNTPLGSDYKIRGNDVYMAIWDQPKEFSNAVKTETCSHTYGGPYVSTTITSTKTKQMFEIYHITQLIKFDGSDGNTQQIWLGEEGKDFYTMHNKPVIFAEDAMYVPGKPKGPKGKEIYLTKISY